MPYYQFIREQILPATQAEIWDFISSPANLSKITPPSMGFDVTTTDIPKKMHPGMVIGYKVSPLPGYRTSWLTEITHVEEGVFFVDEQRLGPYKMWHHQHHIAPHEQGVIMKDIITYIPPMGFLGAIANVLVIRSKLNDIFNFRKKVLEEMFGKV